MTNQYDEFLPEDAEVVDVSEQKELPALMKASDLLPPEEEAGEDEVPPTPEEADLQSLPLAERERIKLAKMTPEQRLRYGAAQAEINANPAVQMLQQTEDLHEIQTATYREAYLKAMAKKKEKA